MALTRQLYTILVNLGPDETEIDMDIVPWELISSHTPPWGGVHASLLLTHGRLTRFVRCAGECAQVLDDPLNTFIDYWCRIGSEQSNYDIVISYACHNLRCAQRAIHRRQEIWASPESEQ